MTIENGNMVQWINGTESKLTHEFADESKEFEKIIIFFQKEIFQGFIREDKKIIMWEDGDIWTKQSPVSFVFVF